MTSSFQKLLFKKFITQTANIYGGERGLFDLLPCGDILMDNLVNEWKKFFIIKEKMLPIKCTMLTPEKVLKASGHVDRFNDFMVKNLETGEFYRADHLIEKHLENMIKSGDKSSAEIEEINQILKKLDNFGRDELNDLIKRFNIKSPDTNQDLSEPVPFNLMFETCIGPGVKNKAYLRPETAQGIFINFNTLLDENNQKLPFAVAQIGTSFRNEISPRSGLLRVREFQMAEIEHFMDPTDKSHEKFVEVKHLNLLMFSGKSQMSGGDPVEMNLGKAVEDGIVANETLGYFIGRIYLFLLKIGIKNEKLRFRQHMPNEMAHYACDCWDAEIKIFNSWVECVGCADRSAFDLECHTKASGVKLVAKRTLDQPKTIKEKRSKSVMKEIGRKFRGKATVVSEFINKLEEDDVVDLMDKLSKDMSTILTINEESYEISKNMIEFIQEDKNIYTEEFTPNVIEPSFGLGRIMNCLLEHNFNCREDDEERTYLTLPPIMAPYKFSILPLSNNKDLVALAKQIDANLTEQDIYCKLDTSSASIGKRYARTDQMGIPFGVTVDFDTLNLEPRSVTVRERDTMKQIRVNLDDLPSLAYRLSNGRLTWQQVTEMYTVFEGQTTVA